MLWEAIVSELVLPEWADELRRRYLSGEASMFLIHGNVRDVQPWDEGNGEVLWLDLRRFLEKFLGRTRDVARRTTISPKVCVFRIEVMRSAFRRPLTQRVCWMDEMFWPRFPVHRVRRLA